MRLEAIDAGRHGGADRFVGLGTMGAAMAANLARAGFHVVGLEPDAGPGRRARGLGSTRGHPAGRSRQRRTSIVVCVSDTPDVEAVLFGPAESPTAPGPGLVIDCSTIAPARNPRLRDPPPGARRRHGGRPGLRRQRGRRKATLSIFVGGEPADVERARPILGAIGTTITHVGPIGAGQAVKAVNQVILAGTYLGVAEGIVLAMKAGLDVEQVVGALGGGGPRAGPRQPQRADARERLPARLQGRSTSRTSGSRSSWPRAGASLPVASLAAQLEDGLVADGHGDDDMSALARSIRARSGLPG